MNGMTFAGVFLFGSGAVALWVNVRYPKLCPDGLPKLVLHLAAGTLCLQLLEPLAAGHAPYVGSQAATKLMSLFVITFPFLTYFLLGITWVITTCTNLAGNRFR